MREKTGGAPNQHRLARRMRGRRRFVAVLGVLSVALSTIAASELPAPADVLEDGGGGDGAGGGGLDPPFRAPANGFEWAMRDRFGAYRDGIVDYHWNQAAPAPLRWGSSDADREKYDPAHVHPSGFEVNLYACPTQAEEDASHLQPPQTANTYHWVIAGQPLAATRSCHLTHVFPNQGPYHVRLTIAGPTPAGPFDQLVVVRDHLIVSIGDSYASGEGNPDVNRSGDQPARWVDKRCHRSAHAGPAQAALALERGDPHSSVTFLSFACSGATISRTFNGYSDACPSDRPPNDTYKSDAFDAYKPGDPARPIGSGILGSYRGVDPPNCPNFADHVPGQLQQVAATVGDRRIDALMVSAGGNDLGFGPLAATCVIAGNCLEHKVTGADQTKVVLPTRFEQDRELLEGRYQALQTALANLRAASGAPMRIAEVYLTEYPDPTTDVIDPKTGVAPACGEMLEDILWLIGAKISGPEVVWARNTVLAALNGHVQAAASQHGWQFVDGVEDAFQGHGYCVGNSDQPNSDRWIRTAAESAVQQGPDAREKTTGTLHPTARGHQVYRDRLLAYSLPALAALPVDDRTPPAAPTAALTNPVNATNQAAALVSGSGEPGTTAHISVDDTSATPPVLVTVPVGWEGFSTTVDVTGLADGPLTATVHLADAAGNTSPSVTATATKDASGPVTNATVNPTPINGWNRGDVTVTLSASDAAGIRDVTYSASGATVIAPTNIAANQASLTLSAEGDTVVSYFARDVSGNTETTKTLTVRIDKTVPVTTIDSLGGNPPRLTPGVPLTGTASDNLSGVEATDVTVRHASGTSTTLHATCTSGCGTVAVTWSVSTSGLRPGSYTVSASSSDVASNVGPPSPDMRVVATPAPPQS